MHITFKLPPTVAALALEPPAVTAYFKRGVLLATRRRGLLFLRALALASALSAALRLLQCLVPALESASASYLVGATVGSATDIATVFTAVAAHHHPAGADQHASFPRMARGNLNRPVLTAAMCGALKLAFGAMVAYNPLPAPVLDKAVFLLATLLCACVEFVFRMAVVVASVEEPRLCGTGAAGRAWRLMRQGKYELAKNYLSGQWMIYISFGLVHTLVAMAGLPLVAWIALSGVVQVDAGGVMCLLRVADEMLSAANTTAYYFESGKMEEEGGESGRPWRLASL